MKRFAMIVLIASLVSLFAAVPVETFRDSLTEDQLRYLESLNEITVLFDPGWAPLEYVDDRGEVSGLSKEYLDTVSKYTGLTFLPISQYSWHEGLEKLYAGEIDMASAVSITDTRLLSLDFSKPYISLPVVIVAGQAVGYVSSLDELEGMPLAVVKSYSHYEWISRDYPNLTLIAVDNVEEGLLLVKKGQAFAFIENLLVANHYLASMNLTSIMKVVGNTPYENSFSMAVGKHLSPLVPIIDAVLEIVTVEQRKSFYAKHIPLVYELRLAPVAIIFIFGLSALVLIVLGVWIWVLIKEMHKREVAEIQQRNSEQDFRQLFSSSPIPMARITLDGKIIGANEAWFATFGYGKGDLPTLEAWYERAYPEIEYRNTVSSRWQKALLERDQSSIESDEYVLHTKNGQSLRMEVSGTFLKDCLLITFIDITKLKQSLDELRSLHLEAERSRKIILSALEDQHEIQLSLAQSKATLDAAINSMLDGMYICDMTGRFILYNRAFLSYYRLSEASPKPSNVDDLSSYIDAYQEDGTAIPPEQWEGRRALRGETGTAEYQLVRKATKERWIGSYSYGPISNEKGTCLGAVVVCRDITHVKAAEQKLLYQRNHDFLTGLFSRVYIEHELQNLRNVLPLTLGIVDVNGLKVLNDSFGNQIGDAILKKTAQLMQQCADEKTILARYGGDEFVFILPLQGSEAAQAYIQRIEEKAKDVCVEAYHLSLSYGYITRIDTNETIQQTLRHAEDVLGRNKIYESTSEKNKAIGLVINSLFAKSNRESMHSKRVSSLSAFLAKKLGLALPDVNRIKIAGLVHDIGKIGVDEAILNKPGRLDLQEWEAIKRHPEIGYRILSSSPEYSDLAKSILEHHERWDGNGYPRGLKGEDASLQARIIMIADSYDAMTSERSYKIPMRKEEAIVEIKRCSGIHYDPKLVDLFLSCIDEYSHSE